MLGFQIYFFVVNYYIALFHALLVSGHIWTQNPLCSWPTY